MAKSQKYKLVLITLFLFLYSLVPVLCHGMVLENIRAGFHKDKEFTRVVLDLRGERSAPGFRKTGHVLEVVLPHGKLSSGKKFNKKFRKSYVRAISVKSGKNMLRVIIDTRLKNILARAFYLDGLANGKKGYRLVLDFFGNARAYRRQSIPKNAVKLEIEKSNEAKKSVSSERKKTKTPIETERPLLPSKPPKQNLSNVRSRPQRRTRAEFNPLSSELRKAFTMPVRQRKKAIKTGTKATNALPKTRADIAVGPDQKPADHRQKGTFSKSPLFGETVKSKPLSDDEPLDSAFHDGEAKESGDPEVYKKRILNAENEIAHKRYVEALSLLAPVKPVILDDEWQKRYYLATQKAAFFSEDYEYALKILKVLLTKWDKIYIDYPDVLKHTGECLYHLKKYEKAPGYLLKYYNLYPADSQNDLLLGKAAECMLKLGEKKLAIQMFKFVIEQYKTADGALIARIRIGELLEDNKNLREEMGMSPDKLYKDVIENSPRSPVSDIARAKLASWYYRHKKYQEGAELLNSLARRAIDSTMLLEVRSTMEQLLTDWVEKLYNEHKYEEITHVYEVYYPYFDPTIHPEYLYCLAESYRITGKLTDAIHYYARALNFGNPLFKEKSLLGLGICYLKLARPQKALCFLSKINEPSLLTLTHFYMGKCYIQMKDYSSAVKTFVKALEENLNSRKLEADAQWWLGFAYYQQGDIEQARKCFREIMKLAKEKKVKIASSRLAMVLYYNANCEIAASNFKEALDDLERALPIAGDTKLKKAISENLALLFMEINSKTNGNDQVTDKKIKVKSYKMNDDVNRAIENKEKIKALQKQLEETNA